MTVILLNRGENRSRLLATETWQSFSAPRSKENAGEGSGGPDRNRKMSSSSISCSFFYFLLLRLGFAEHACLYLPVGNRFNYKYSPTGAQAVRLSNSDTVCPPPFPQHLAETLTETRAPLIKGALTSFRFQLPFSSQLSLPRLGLIILSHQLKKKREKMKPIIEKCAFY